jgi:hypothetical protein
VVVAGQKQGGAAPFQYDKNENDVTDAVESSLQLGFDGVGSGGGRLYSTTNQVAPEGSESTYRLARTKAGAWGK